MRRPSFNSSTLMIAIFVSSLRQPPGLFKELRESTCAGPLNLGKSLVGLPRILPYCYKPVSVASMYAHRASLDPLAHFASRASRLSSRFSHRRFRDNPGIETCWRSDCRRSRIVRYSQKTALLDPNRRIRDHGSEFYRGRLQLSLRFSLCVQGLSV